MIPISDKERMVALTRELLSQGKSADEIRVKLSLIDTGLLQELNAIPRQNIRCFMTDMASSLHLEEPILDLGCGYRSNKPEVALGLGHAPARYFGIDHTITFKKPVELGAGPDVQGDALSLPFQSGSLRTVICTEVLEHVPDDRETMAEIARVASSNALLVITVPGRDIPRHETPPYQIDRRRYTVGSLVRLIEDGGVQILESRGIDSLGFQTNIFAVAQKK